MTPKSANVFNKPVVIYGVGKTSSVLTEYLRLSKFTIAAYTVEQQFIVSPKFKNKPVVDFDELTLRYPNAEFDLMIAIGYQDMNQQRERIYNECKLKGYKVASYIHPSAVHIDKSQIGEGTIIFDNVSIQPGAVIGNNTYIWSGAIIAHGSQVMDNCWIAAACVIAGDATINNNSFLGVNCTIGHNVILGESTFVGANTLVAKDTSADTAIISAEGEKLRLNSHQFVKFAKV